MPVCDGGGQLHLSIHKKYENFPSYHYVYTVWVQSSF
jgi:hypothetical protein